MHGFISRVSVLARQIVLPGFLAQSEGTERGGNRPEPEPYVDFIDGPYQIIRDKSQIISMLKQVLDASHPISLTGRRSACAVDTTLMSIDAAHGRILLKELMNDASHSQLLLDGRANITARHNDVPLMFSLELSESGFLDGIPCYMASIPEWILFAQMRDSFRIYLPQVSDARLSFHCTGVGPIEARVLDISESGIGALIPAGLARAVTASDTILNASLRTDGGSLSSLGIRLRYVDAATGGPQKIGAVLDLSTEFLRQSLRRLIMRHQRLHAQRN